MDKLWDEGRIVITPTNKLYIKRYLDESKGVPLQDLWLEIDMLRGFSSSKERLGFPTQKPLALLERVANLSSNPGDIVLDPFCGCGTALVAAQTLDRQ
jgi:DNA modification methylase